MSDLDRTLLDALDEPAFCRGTLQIAERLAIVLPDGDLAAVDDPTFVDWLVDHGELAPFGMGAQTRTDPAVRRAIRLTARGKVRVSGFDPATLLAEIETTFSPRTHLLATLTDVLVYPVGGHFATHKDTPTSPDLIGTLVVGLPIQHQGGAFEIEDALIDWGGHVDAHTLRWVAMFSDADHAVQRVNEGHRVTLVYALALSDRPRIDHQRDARLAMLRAAVPRLRIGATPRMIACARQVIALDGPQPQGIDTLRGADRDLAEVLVAAGFHVVVRTCVAARDVDDPPVGAEDLPGDADGVFYARLRRPFLDGDIAGLLDCVVFDELPAGDGGGYDDGDATSLAPWIEARVPAEDWIVRRYAAATFLRALDFADDGYIGNGAYTAYLYKLAALEVTRRR